METINFILFFNSNKSFNSFKITKTFSFSFTSSKKCLFSLKKYIISDLEMCYCLFIDLHQITKTWFFLNQNNECRSLSAIFFIYVKRCILNENLFFVEKKLAAHNAKNYMPVVWYIFCVSQTNLFINTVTIFGVRVDESQWKVL